MKKTLFLTFILLSLLAPWLGPDAIKIVWSAQDRGRGGHRKSL